MPSLQYRSCRSLLLHVRSLAAFASALGVVVFGAACSDTPTAPAARTAVTPSFSMATWQGTNTPAALVSRFSPTQCMDVAGGSTAPGTQVQIWTCLGNSAQSFVWQPNGEIRYGAMCVDASGGAGNNGDGIIVWPCTGGANQHWVGTAAGEIKGVNGRCIDVYGLRTANGSRLVLWDCWGGGNQMWDERVASTTSSPQPVAPSATAAAVLAFMGASNVPSVAALQAKGGVYARYESDFASFANQMWASDSTSFTANFYDRAMIYYVWWARTGNATYLDRANKLAIGARTYLESTNYYPPSYDMMIDGVALHALVTGDQRSAATVAKVGDTMANPNGYWSYVAGNPGDHDGDSRNSARVLTAVLDAYLLKVPSPSGYNYGALLPDLERRILTTQSPDGAYRWPNQCYYNKPFMTGMLDDALIRYYTSFQADAHIVSSVKLAVDYMWSSDWFPASSAFTYLDGTCTAESGGAPGAPDLNNLTSSGYAFVAKQTGDASYFAKSDAVFSGGVYGAWLYGTKQFNQEYTASYRFLSLRF